jgi:carbon storage regulator CsrA
MLVLSRKIGEAVVIGDGIVVTVTRVAGNRVTLGITAPDDVRILRGELMPTGDSFPSQTENPPTNRLRLVAR